MNQFFVRLIILCFCVFFAYKCRHPLTLPNKIKMIFFELKPPTSFTAFAQNFFLLFLWKKGKCASFTLTKKIDLRARNDYSSVYFVYNIFTFFKFFVSLQNYCFWGHLDLPQTFGDCWLKFYCFFERKIRKFKNSSENFLENRT